MVNFYRKFTSGTALLLRPLTDFLKGDPKAFSWSPEMASPFSVAKTALALVPALVHPDSFAKISLAIDSSDSHVGAVFQQLVHSSWAPLAFFSRKLSSANSRYSAFDRELLAAYSAVRHFCVLLKGRDSPYSPTTSLSHTLCSGFLLVSTATEAAVLHLGVHLPGSQDLVADALSRPPSPSPPSLPFPVSTV